MRKIPHMPPEPGVTAIVALGSTGYAGTGVSTRRSDKGYEEASCRTAGPPIYIACRTGCARDETLPSQKCSPHVSSDHGEIRRSATPTNDFYERLHSLCFPLHPI